MNLPTHSELLTIHEQRLFSDELANYISISRNNALATLQAYPGPTTFIQHTDRFWQDALQAMDPLPVNTPLHSLFLYPTAHSCFRSAVLGLFSGAIVPASAALRTAIECVRHAHVLVRFPDSVDNWLGMSGNGDPRAKDKNKNAFHSFMKQAKESSNEAFHLLDSHWRFFCDFGAHSSKLSVFGSMDTAEVGSDTKFSSAYLTSNERTLQTFIFRYSTVGYQSVRLLFNDFHGRFNLIPSICRSFENLEHSARTLERELNQFKLQARTEV